MDYLSVIKEHKAIFQLLQISRPVAVQSVIFFLILIIILLLISALTSGAEVAFFSLTTRDINMLKTRQNKNARIIIRLLEKPRLLQATLLVTNFLVNIFIILIANYLIDLIISYKQNIALSFLVKVIIITMVVILFGEIIPRIYAAQYTLRTALSSAQMIGFFQSVLKPVSNAFALSAERIESKLRSKNAGTISIKEIDKAIESSVDPSASEEEKNILKSILQFSNITVRQIMRTRLDIFGINYNISFAQLIATASELHYSRLPVYKDNLDNIVGIVHTKDLLAKLDEKDSFDWHELMRPPYYIHEQKLIEDLMKEFQNKHVHFAVVVDEFGGTSGIVTLEDIVEEVIGEIQDEFDEEEFTFSKIDDHNYLFDGKMMLNDVCRIMNISPETFEAVKGQSDSLAGLILEIAGEFPEQNSVISYRNYEFKITEVNKTRLQKVQVTILPANNESE